MSLRSQFRYSISDFTRIWKFSSIEKARLRLAFSKRSRLSDFEIPIKSSVSYLTKIESVLEYGAEIWGCRPQYLADNIESTQNRCLKSLESLGII
jgi:hypothetical protein